MVRGEDRGDRSRGQGTGLGRRAWGDSLKLDFLEEASLLVFEGERLNLRFLTLPNFIGLSGGFLRKEATVRVLGERGMLHYLQIQVESEKKREKEKKNPRMGRIQKDIGSE